MIRAIFFEKKKRTETPQKELYSSGKLKIIEIKRDMLGRNSLQQHIEYISPYFPHISTLLKGRSRRLKLCEKSLELFKIS